MEELEIRSIPGPIIGGVSITPPSFPAEVVLIDPFPTISIEGPPSVDISDVLIEDVNFPLIPINILPDNTLIVPTGPIPVYTPEPTDPPSVFGGGVRY